MEGINAVGAMAEVDQAKRATIECLIIGGIGGTMPTLTRLGAALVSESDPSLPHPTFLIGLAIYFVIGAVLVYAFTETSVKRAFLAGIAAPALIANIVAGVQEANEARSGSVTGQAVEQKQGAVGGMWFIPAAYAQEVPPTETPAGEEPGTAVPAPQSSDGDGTTQDYVYRIKTRTHGQADVVVEVVVQEEDGEIRHLTLGSHSVVDLKTEKPLSSIQVVGPGNSQLITFSDEQKLGATVDIDAEVSRKRGLFWALGGKDTPRVEEFTVGVEPLTTSGADGL